MKPLSSIEIILCRLQAKLFAASVDKTQYSSLIFIRRFMYSSVAESFDKGFYLYQTNYLDESLDMIDEEFGETSYGKIKYSKDQMYWIGYIYRCISIKYNLSSRVLYKLINAKEIVKYYNICHTFDIVDAVERIMESINYVIPNIQDEAYKLMKRLRYIEKLNEFLGQLVTVIVDRPIGFTHNGTVYQQNYGHIENLTAPDGQYQDAYIIGEDKLLKTFKGKVIAIIDRKNDKENKLVVCDESKNFSKEEIKRFIACQEKSSKIKVLM